MSDEFLGHLFEPFIRSNKVSKVEGTGLGLSITKGLVDLMGGEIRVQSKLHQGTKFEIELEFELVENTAFDLQREDGDFVEEDLSGYHFLLVEDNEINSEILGELLQMRGATSVSYTHLYSDIAKDVIRPSAEECIRNSRARSTKMRWAIRA